MDFKFETDKEIKGFTTFGIACRAKYFRTFKSVDELKAIISSDIYKSEKAMVLGGGSNVLFTKDFDGLILLNELKGVSEGEHFNDSVILEFASGEAWHEAVLYAVSKGYGGIENLSFIPGSVGAAPMQNIGAYGKELKDVFVSLTALEIATGAIKTFGNEACNFGYRESVFKRELKNQFIILSVKLKLTTKNHEMNTSYGAINAELEGLKLEPTIKNISDAVIAIRQRKLPNPKEIGNSGSFFKNPVVTLSQFESIKKDYPEVPNYPAPNGHVKLAAGWLIEKAGWKGKTIGEHGVHKNQALVLVNYGNAKGADVYQLSQDILDDVQTKFGIVLEREVNII